jgi:hypothetical protein
VHAFIERQFCAAGYIRRGNTKNAVIRGGMHASLPFSGQKSEH